MGGSDSVRRRISTAPADTSGDDYRCCGHASTPVSIGLGDGASIRSGKAAKTAAAAVSIAPACSLLQRRRLSLVPQKLRSANAMWHWFLRWRCAVESTEARVSIQRRASEH